MTSKWIGYKKFFRIRGGGESEFRNSDRLKIVETSGEDGKTCLIFLEILMMTTWHEHYKRYED